MTNLVIMPAKAKKGMGWSDFAEEATIIEETVKPERANHFIEANTQCCPKRFSIKTKKRK